MATAFLCRQDVLITAQMNLLSKIRENVGTYNPQYERYALDIFLCHESIYVEAARELPEKTRVELMALLKVANDKGIADMPETLKQLYHVAFQKHAGRNEDHSNG
jgi:hypothetical protein